MSDNLEPNQTTPTVTTDKQDYKPGSTALISTAGFSAGSTIQFSVQIINAGADGIIGTADDFLSSAFTWFATDGAASDGDGTANGGLATSFYVTPAYANTTILLTAAQVSVADDGTVTQDGPAATHVFTDFVIPPSLTKTGTIINTNDCIVGDAGDVVVYDIVLTAGSYTIGQIVLTDTLPDGTVITLTDPVPLQADPDPDDNVVETRHYTVTYTIRPEDVGTGAGNHFITNTVTLSDVYLDGAGNVIYDDEGNPYHDELDPATATTQVYNHSLDIVKTGTVVNTNGNGLLGDDGDTIVYTVTVTNTGNSTLSAIVVNDPFTDGITPLPGPSTLAAGASGSYTVSSHVITLAEALAGSVTNTATVNDCAGDSDSSTVTNLTIASASLGDRLWVDTNHNGQQDDGATGIVGATVTLLGGGADGLLSTLGDNTSTTTTTGVDGFYQFTGLTPGVEYQVQFSAPGYLFTSQDVGNDASDSDVNGAGLSQIVTLSSGEYNPTIDAGVYQTASLGDRLWVDTNHNGQQDDGATGIVGATVTLLGGGADGLLSTLGDNTSTTTTTGVDGFYQFTGLTPGVEYQVQFSAPGYLFTSQDVGNDASDSDVNGAGLSQIVTLSSGEYNPTIDAGVYQTASLGDRLWVDTNHNGQQDDGATGIVGATVTLLGGGADGLLSTLGDNTSTTTTTGVDGFYQFTGLTPGVEYQVQFSAPGYLFTSQDVGNDASDSDVNGAGLSQIVTLSSGEYNPTIDAGVYQTASLGDRLWVDTNHNGQQDDGATGIVGATVTLLGGGADGLLSTLGDNTSTTTTTGVDGFYQFTGLTPGVEYQVQFSAPGYLFTSQDVGNDASDSDVNGAGLSQIVTLSSGEYNPTIDAGVYQTASLGDRLWVDTNHNGQQDDGATGIVGATVTLLGGGADGLLSTLGDNTSTTTTTGVDGFYQFTGLTPGVEYQVQFSAPGYLFTSQDVGNDASDSDVNGAGLSQIVTLSSGEYNPTIDAGVYQTASLGDRLWVDTNHNGQQDDGATGIVGATVTLLGGGADGLLSTLGDNTSTTTTTGVDGFYQFTGLTPGVEYQVQFSAQAGYAFTTQNVGNDASDSDADTTTGKTQIVTLGSGEYNPTLDAGVFATNGDLKITKTDGLTTVLDGQTITYTIVVSNTGTADAIGAVVKDTFPGGLTNVHWTSTASGGASGNDASGMGSINDTVNLVAGSSITYTVNATVSIPDTVADFSLGANNTSLGQNITINGVKAEAFYLSGASYVSTNTVLWERNQPSDHGIGVWSNGEPDPIANGGDVNEISNQLHTDVVRLTLAAGQTWSSLWVSSLDSGGSASQETGTVYWSNSATPDLSTLSTKFTFKYGDFGVGVEEGDVLTLGPSGFDRSAQYLFFVAGPNAAGTNNDYLLWKATTCGAVLTNTATVTAPNGFTDTNSNNNSATDIDTVVCPAGLGDRLWVDTNGNGQQDDGATGLSGKTVTLIGGGADGLINGIGDTTTTTTTGTDGFYQFTGLTPGVQYQVQFSAPSGYAFTTANVGSDTSDSDANTVTGKTQIVTLGSGEFNSTLDAGLVATPGSIGDLVFCDANSNGKFDAGEGVVAGVTVKLIGAGADNTFNTSDDVTLATTTTNVNGNYSFTGLQPGQYQVQFVAPAGHGLSPQDQGSNDNIDSDANTSTGKTGVITLGAGQAITNVDAGILPITTEFVFNGNTALNGTAGNILNASSGGINVHVSAWSRDKSTGTGAWTTAYLGNYSGGLGVTDPTEDGNNNTHTVDNNGTRYNYVVFELDQSVILDKAFLGYVVGDSDLKVWIGNFSNPYNNHLTMSDSVLSAMGFSEVNAGGSSTRWADVNAGNFSGNVIIIGADNTGGTDDYFKIQKLDVNALACQLQLMAQLGDRVWYDTNKNGQQDAGELGAAGVTVKLLNSGGTVIGTTTTDANGGYAFTNLNAGTYQVQFVPLAGYTFTSQNVGNDASDSDADLTTGKTQLVTLAAGENNPTLDAGLVAKPKLTIDKTDCWTDTNCDGLADAGDVITYTITVKNVFTSTVSGINVTDPALKGTTALNGTTALSLAAGASKTYTLTYTIKQADIDSNTSSFDGVADDKLTNTAIATYGTDSVSDTETTDISYCPWLEIEKMVSADGGATWYLTNSQGVSDSTVISYVSQATGIATSKLFVGTPSVMAGTAVQFKVVMKNFGDVTENNITANDATDDPALNGASFKFGGSTTLASLAPGAVKVSDALTTTALLGTHTDTVTVSGKVGTSTTTTTLDTDTASYAGTFSADCNAHDVAFWKGCQTSWDEAIVNGQKGILLGDYTGTAWLGGSTTSTPKSMTSVAAGMLFIPEAAAAQLLAYGPGSTGDVRQQILAHAIVAQLNIDNGVNDPGYYPGTNPSGHDLIGEAVKWLTGASPFGTGGNVDTKTVDRILSTGSGTTYEFNTANHTLAGTAATATSAAWKTLYNPGGGITVDGKDLLTALVDFNTGQLVTSMAGYQVGWNSSAPTDIKLNNPDTFWTVLQDKSQLTH